ncbi:sigma-70 family RNA polymerase sigma factor [Thermodesulforhabdus norvegica]|uniref:RNA polymerase sigma factor n=1 Tax=Thermodesulforhabdus norvegica TaxID=39841 RepID=A0A1I4QH18_9BACT|nr:RNA polymerase factor sigma-32 [Thermodesulforhabdus norvegica]SFM39368.1 RNA polymerase sigma-32 factor [Thermodesulforhabdus norvegica]
MSRKKQRKSGEDKEPVMLPEVTDETPLLEEMETSDIAPEKILPARHDFFAGTEPVDPLVLYLQEIRKYPLLTREEEIELAKRYKEKGDLEAAYKLVTSNLRLVVKIAMEFQKYWMQNLMDLIQEGNIGLMQAVKKFDPYRGYKFSYYASFWIKAYIIKFIMDNWNLVKIGTTQAQRKLFFNLRKEKERLERQGIEATPQLISERLQVRESDVIEMDQRLSGSEMSLDSPVSSDSEDTHLMFLPDSSPAIDDQMADAQARQILREKLAQFRKHLKDKEAVIFDERLMAEEPLTLQEIGDRFGISRERVRQIEQRLKKKLKAYLEEEIDDLDLLQESLIDV